MPFWQTKKFPAIMAVPKWHENNVRERLAIGLSVCYLIQIKETQMIPNRKRTWQNVHYLSYLANLDCYSLIHLEKTSQCKAIRDDARRMLDSRAMREIVAMLSR